MAQIINLKLDGGGAFADLVNKQNKVIHLTEQFTIAVLERGMTSGRPSIAIRIDLPDGGVVLQETSVRAFLAAASGIRGRFPDV